LTSALTPGGGQGSLKALPRGSRRLWAAGVMRSSGGGTRKGVRRLWSFTGGLSDSKDGTLRRDALDAVRSRLSETIQLVRFSEAGRKQCQAQGFKNLKKMSFRTAGGGT